MSKAKKTTTGWRQRYLVTTFEMGRVATVLLVRGRLRKATLGSMMALVSKDKHKGWRWETVDIGPHPWKEHQTRLFEAAERPEMVGYVSSLRLLGYALEGGMPSW